MVEGVGSSCRIIGFMPDVGVACCVDGSEMSAGKNGEVERVGAGNAVAVKVLMDVDSRVSVKAIMP